MRALLLVLILAPALALLPACGDDAGTNGGQDADNRKDTPPSAGLPDWRPRAAAALETGAAYLLTQQDDKGAFGDKEIQLPGNVAYTAMAVPGLVASRSVGEERITKALSFIVGFQQENGSIVDNPKITNYCTSVSVSALASAKRSEFRQAQSKAAAYLASSQIAEDASDLSYGGFPYKQHLGQPADASNALIATNALEADGLPEDSEVRTRVGQYVSRILNNSEANTQPVEVEVDGETRTVVSGDDLGAFYNPVESKAGMVKRSDGKWEFRSYGSMTYAALKLMMFAGVPADDPRVKGVVQWISRHWTLERNPGFEEAEDPEKAGQQGMFYYFYTAARALDAYEKASGEPLTVVDADGRKHDWRAEIAEELLRRQNEDGSWRNAIAERWEEGSKTLATGFALQTLGHLLGRL